MTSTTLAEPLRSRVAQAAAAFQDSVAQLASHQDEEAHQIFHSQPKHAQHAHLAHTVPGVAPPGSTGVVYVSDRAAANGYRPGGGDGWANFGQGAPEVGRIPGAAPKPTRLDLEAFGEDVHEYAPTTGTRELRQAVADYYNRTFRQNHIAQFTHENIAIVPGGRAGLARLLSVLEPTLLSVACPDYAAYESLLTCFKNVQTVTMQTEASDGFQLHLDQLRKEVVDKGITAVLRSNPNNPCGQLIEGEELRSLVEMSSELNFTLMLDEFYSWYLHEGPEGRSVSAAEFVEDIDESNVVLVDGLTKNWRCPGWRVCWICAPRDVIAAIQQAGSFLDGGASHPMQCLALQMLEPERVEQDRVALQRHFRKKRQLVLERLEKMGFKIDHPPQATFYLWLPLHHLPAPLDRGLVFFEELLKLKCIVTPGPFFSLNPSHLRNVRHNVGYHYVRLSFGPPIEELQRGLDAIESLVERAKRGDLEGVGKALARRRHDTHLADLHAPAAGS